MSCLWFIVVGMHHHISMTFIYFICWYNHIFNLGDKIPCFNHCQNLPHCILPDKISTQRRQRRHNSSIPRPLTMNDLLRVNRERDRPTGLGLAGDGRGLGPMTRQAGLTYWTQFTSLAGYIYINLMIFVSHCEVSLDITYTQ